MEDGQGERADEEPLGVGSAREHEQFNSYSVRTVQWEVRESAAEVLIVSRHTLHISLTKMIITPTIINTFYTLFNSKL